MAGHNFTTIEPVCALSPSRVGYHNISDLHRVHDGVRYNYLFYTYNTCQGFAIHVKYVDRHIIQCICRPHISFAVVGVILALFGIILNSTIIRIYHKRKAIQNKGANLLLVNQAMVNWMNCFAYVLFASLHSITLYINPYRKRFQFFYTVYASNGFHDLSYTSSILTFTVIAIERLFAVVFPIKHRNYMKKSYITGIMVLVWIVSSGGALTIWISTYMQKVQVYRNYLVIELYSYLCLIAVVTILFGVTFYKALIFLRKLANGPSQGESNMHMNKRELRLVIIFIIMYATFLLSLIPKVLGIFQYIKGNFNQNALTAAVLTLLFCASSICDPLLTLFIREDFKVDEIMCKGRESTIQPQHQNTMLSEVSLANAKCNAM